MVRVHWHALGAGFWQVGDNEEHNGSGKNALKGGKKDLPDKKGDLGLPLTIEKYVIMTLMNWAWNKSFARVESNKKAIYDRGWSPRNRALLDYP
jgi:hypothetical protein